MPNTDWSTETARNNTDWVTNSTFDNSIRLDSLTVTLDSLTVTLLGYTAGIHFDDLLTTEDWSAPASATPTDWSDA